MSTWTSWLLGEESDKKKDASESVTTTDEGKKEEDEDVWTKRLEVAGGWMQNVASYANTLTDTVKKQVNDTASGGFLGDFQKEQEKFQRKMRQEKDASIPPWVGYNEEEQMKTQVLELSADSRNFLREPPHGVNFEFDYEKVAPVAMVMLKEDPKLQKLRFELVPKKVAEKVFWRNYFYRISLIKQSVQISTLSSEAKSPQSSLTGSDTREQPDSSTESPRSKKNEDDQLTPGTDSVEEFASDQLYNSSTVSKETVQSELTQLGVTDPPSSTDDDKIGDWDELKAELDELDLGETEGSSTFPADWEEELQSMLSEDSKES